MERGRKDQQDADNHPAAKDQQPARRLGFTLELPAILHPVALRQLDLLSYRGSDLVYDPQKVASRDVALHHDLSLDPLPADEVGAPILVDVGYRTEGNFRSGGRIEESAADRFQVFKTRLR